MQDENTIWSNIFRKEKKVDQSLSAVLKKIPMFQDLNKKELKAIERILHRRTYRIDEQVISEGEPGVGMYIIEKGKVIVTLGKERKLLAELGDGDFFGEMALLLESERTASITAVEPSSMLGFFQPDLFSLLETKPRTGNKILLRLAQMISERLRRNTIENRELRLKLIELEKATASEEL